MKGRGRKAKQKPKRGPQPKLVRKSILIEQAKIDFVRRALALNSDTEVLRFALDHLISHFEHNHEEEE